MATPVALVLVSAGHSSTRSGGAVITGGVVSRTVICWTQVLALPQSSVAVQVRLMILTVSPGKTGGCCGNGPSGGCGCGGGNAKILPRFPSESVCMPTKIGVAGTVSF